jgi:FtsZ-binding cell division protein ZapB
MSSSFSAKKSPSKTPPLPPGRAQDTSTTGKQFIVLAPPMDSDTAHEMALNDSGKGNETCQVVLDKDGSTTPGYLIFDMKGLLQEVKEMRGENASLNKEMKEMQTRVSGLLEENASLNKEMEEMRGENASLNKEMAKMQTRVSGLEGRVVELEIDNKLIKKHFKVVEIPLFNERHGQAFCALDDITITTTSSTNEP